MNTCTIANLEMILSEMSQLVLLNVCLQGDISNINRIRTLSPVRWLKLIKNDFPITMNQIESFLPNLPLLKHVEFYIKGQIDLVDGYRWEILVNNLLTFNFNICVKLDSVETILDSFRTEFWLSKKCWYVAYDDQCLFTVPPLIRKQVLIPYYPPKYFTGPDETIFYDYITSVEIREPRRTTLNRFRHLKQLTVYCSITPKYFFSDIDLSRIEHLILTSLDNIRSFILYINAMPYLSKLTVTGFLTNDFVNNLQDHRTAQIRTLKIVTSTKDLSYIIEGLIRLFPRVEHLDISMITLKKDMIRLIDGFQSLSIASFTIGFPLSKNDQIWSVKPELSIRGVRRLRNGTFTCRYLRSSVQRELHLWIREQTQQSWQMKYLLPQRGYLWYRSMNILSEYTLNSDLYKFIAQISKTYRTQITRVFRILVIIVAILILYDLIYLLYIDMFRNGRWFMYAYGLISYIFALFFSHFMNRLFLRVIPVLCRICLSIFNFLSRYFNT